MTRQQRWGSVSALGLLSLLTLLLARWQVEGAAGPLVRLQGPDQQVWAAESAPTRARQEPLEAPSDAVLDPTAALIEAVPSDFALRTSDAPEGGPATYVFAHENGSGLLLFRQQLDEAAVANTTAAMPGRTLPDGTHVAVAEHETSRQVVLVTASGEMLNLTLQTTVPLSVAEIDAGSQSPQADTLPMTTAEVEALALRLATLS